MDPSIVGVHYHTWMQHRESTNKMESWKAILHQGGVSDYCTWVQNSLALHFLCAFEVLYFRRQQIGGWRINVHPPLDG
jgi:hypothetical protein